MAESRRGGEKGGGRGRGGGGGGGRSVSENLESFLAPAK